MCPVRDASTAEYASDGGVADGESGIITYSLAPAATTYTWVASGEGVKNWNTPSNWQYGDSVPATRCPTEIDTVIFNDGANVTISGVSCAAMTVNGSVTISGSGDLCVSDNVLAGANAVLNLSGVCLKNIAAQEILVGPNVNFVSGAGLAGNVPGTDSHFPIKISGAVSISGEFKAWDVEHIFANTLSVANDATLSLNHNLTVQGQTTFNGNFSKSRYSAQVETPELNLGDVVIAATTTPTIYFGSIILGGDVTISSGAKFTIPSSGVTYSAATFSGAGMVSFATPPAAALTFNGWTGSSAINEKSDIR